MDNMQEIVKILQEQVINKTLNLEGIREVEKIISRNEVLEDLKKNSDKAISELNKSERELRSRAEEAERKLRAANKELDDYKKKDKEFYEQSIKFEYEQRRATELIEIVGMALRNPVITTSRMGGHDQLNAHGGTQYCGINETETKTVG